MARRREVKGFPRPDRKRVIPPDHEEWRGLPRGLEYVKEATWNLGIIPHACTSFTGPYVYYIEPEQLATMQALHDELERSGDLERLYKWVEPGPRATEGKHTVWTLFSIMNTLEEIGKLKVGMKPKRMNATRSQRFPAYLVAAADEFYDFCHRGFDLSRLTKAQERKLKWLAARAHRDWAKINKYLRNRSNPARLQNAVFQFQHFLVEGGFMEDFDDV